MEREISDIIDRTAAGDTESKKVLTRINRKKKNIRQQIISLTRSLYANALALEDPKFDKYHREKNQQVKNLISEHGQLSAPEEHEKLMLELSRLYIEEKK